MEIPKTFRVGKTRYKVTMVDTLPRAFNTGRVNFVKGQMTIARSCNQTGKERGADAQAHTFWHEFVHAALHDMGRPRLCSNEYFVDQMAKRIMDVVRTARF
jgi:hypothetical protein